MRVTAGVNPTISRLACLLFTLGAVEAGLGAGPGAGAGAGAAAGAGEGDDSSGVSHPGEILVGEAPPGEVTPSEAC